MKKCLNRRRYSAYQLENVVKGGIFSSITGKSPLIYPETSSILDLTGKIPLILFPGYAITNKTHFLKIWCLLINKQLPSVYEIFQTQRDSDQNTRPCIER